MSLEFACSRIFFCSALALPFLSFARKCRICLGWYLLLTLTFIKSLVNLTIWFDLMQNTWNFSEYMNVDIYSHHNFHEVFPKLKTFFFHFQIYRLNLKKWKSNFFFKCWCLLDVHYIHFLTAWTLGTSNFPAFKLIVVLPKFLYSLKFVGKTCIVSRWILVVSMFLVFHLTMILLINVPK